MDGHTNYIQHQMRVCVCVHTGTWSLHVEYPNMVYNSEESVSSYLG